MDYDFFDLGFNRSLWEINAKGQIVGNYGANDGTIGPAFRYSDGKFEELPSVGGTATTLGAVINDAGDVAGVYGPFPDYKAFLWSGGQMIDVHAELNAAKLNLQSSFPVGLGSEGDVFGEGRNLSLTHNTYWHRKANGHIKQIDSVIHGHQIVQLTSSNSARQIAGLLYKGDVRRGFVYSVSHGTLEILPEFAGYLVFPFDLDDEGDVTGTVFWDTDPNLQAAFRRDGGGGFEVLTKVGSKKKWSWGAAVNEAAVVGTAGNLLGSDSGTSAIDTFPYVRDAEGVVDLSPYVPAYSGLTAFQPRDINEAGWIIGYGYTNDAAEMAENPNFPCHGILLKPRISLPQSASALAAVRVLWGVLNDAPGPVVTPSGHGGHVGPGPGDPGPDGPGWLWSRLSSAEQELLAGFSIGALADLIPNSAARQAIKRIAGDVARGGAAASIPGTATRGRTIAPVASRASRGWKVERLLQQLAARAKTPTPAR